MIPEDGELYFGRTHRPEGFTGAAIAQFDGSAEPVVRELIQNSLDAADHAEVPIAEVNFIISEATRDELPGWSKYIAVFQEARRQRRSQPSPKRSQDERMVVERIESSSRPATIPLLLCIDNGHGLSGERMDALLTPGNTSKGERGAGSFGLGHHAAFGASDLRYVLYGAKFFNKDESISEIASGHAILASYRDKENVLRAADGYWFKSGRGHLAFNGNYDCYPDTLPRLLWELLAGVETGTVVCIAGFNDFRREEDDPTPMNSICRVAASNFCDAIHSGRLRVGVEDDCAGETLTVGRDNLGEILTRYSQNKRAAKQGQISGQVAYNAWKTISLGERLASHGNGMIRRLHRWLARPEVGAGFDVTSLWDHGDMSKAHEIVRTGMRLAEFFRRFPDDRAAEVWFVSRRWPSGPVCPHCGGGRVSEVASRRPMPYRCRECRKHFSVMSHTLMHASKLGAQTWLLAIFLIVANPKGRSSVQLAADLGVTQKTAWHLAHRIRQALAEGGLPGFDGPVEADETYIGGKARNRHAHKADPGKTAVIGVKDRRTGTVAATPVHEVTTATATAMVAATTRQGAEVYTDGSRIYDPLAAMGFNHARVIHGLGEYVRGSVSTNGVENYWSLLKRTYIGTYHYMSDDHLHRYIEEHSFRYNRRNRHVIDKMSEAAAAMEGRSLTYRELTGSRG